MYKGVAKTERKATTLLSNNKRCCTCKMNKNLREDNLRVSNSKCNLKIKLESNLSNNQLKVSEVIQVVEEFNKKVKQYQVKLDLTKASNIKFNYLNKIKNVMKCNFKCKNK